MTNIPPAPVLAALAAALFAFATPARAAEEPILGKTRTELEQVLKGWILKGDVLANPGSTYYARDGVEVDAKFKDGKIVGISVRPANDASTRPDIDQRLQDTRKLLGMQDAKPAVKPNKGSRPTPVEKTIP